MTDGSGQAFRDRWVARLGWVKKHWRWVLVAAVALIVGAVRL